MTPRSACRHSLRVFSAAAIVCGFAITASGQPTAPRFLGHEEIVLYGIGLRVEPAHQTVPKDLATIVSTYLQTPTLPSGLPPFAPDAEIVATLRGPSFGTPRELRVQPNRPFEIPPLTVPGTHSLEDIRLVSGGRVLLRGTPEQVTIDVIERLLVTQVTARPLTAAEIREKGIVYDRSSFQAYNFSAAFAIQDRKIDINFPVLLPSLQGAADVELGQASLPRLPTPQLPTLRTIIPDTLKLQTQIPNLSVVGFSLKVPALEGEAFVVPPIPAVIVIPGDIAFLNQFFSVMLMVGNVAPEGSGLVVSELTAEIVLPPGRDSVVGSADDPLRMARTADGETPRVRVVVQAGPDGQLGTGDDIQAIGPGESGNAEYLVEGRREGSHVVEMEISGTLNGLPIGPVAVRGRAAGSVLVRNPTFTLTFTHPDVVSAGEPYTLDVTVTNTSQSPANFVEVTLYPRNVSGATIAGESTLRVESIAPGDSAVVTFDLVSRLTGKVTAATLDSDEKVAGRFELKTAVGELGVPLSPDSLVLPKEAGSLPRDLRDAALGLLGKAYAVATAPGAALPLDVTRFSRKIVWDRAVEVAAAGFRHTLREPLADSAAQLAMDFIGSDYTRLGTLVAPDDLSFELENFTGFDELRRRSVRGDVFASAVAGVLAPGLESQGPQAFHYALAQKWSYRPAHLAVLVSAQGALPIDAVLRDPSGRETGAVAANGKTIKDIPFSDVLPFRAEDGAVRAARLIVAAAPDPGAYVLRIDASRAPPDAQFSMSVILPAADGTLRQVVFEGLQAGQRPVVAAADGDSITLTVAVIAPAGPTDVAPGIDHRIIDPPPSVISVIQQKNADTIGCEGEGARVPVGRVVAVLFSEEVTPASAHDQATADAITNYAPEANRVVSVALQPGRRIAFLALRDPLGPFIPRQIGIENVTDLRGQQMAPYSGPMESTLELEGAVVTGHVQRADGTKVPYADVRLFYLLRCDTGASWIGISAKSADAEAAYGWDYVLDAFTSKIVAIDPESGEHRTVPFDVQRGGQRLNVELVFLGRGTFIGTTRSEAGVPLRDTVVRLTSLTDGEKYGARTDASGRFVIPQVAVGSFLVEAVNVQQHATFSFSELMPFAGATVQRDITLIDVEKQQITVKHGNVQGFVFRADGVSPASQVPVFVWYRHLSQPGVKCPGDPPLMECAIAAGQTDAAGAFTFAGVAAGELRVSTFDQDGYVQGSASLVLAPDATASVNVLLRGGLGTVAGRVLDAEGNGVPGARVGGGLVLATTDANGNFTLVDVPIGRRTIVAASDALASSARVEIDLIRPGDTVNATLVLDAVSSVSGVVTRPDGLTPATGVQVYVFEDSPLGINVLGMATTNASGGYRIDGIRADSKQRFVSSFDASFTEGNIVPISLKYHGQVVRADLRYRGSGGRVVGRVLDDDGQTPLKAMVSLSGEQLQIAGGRVGVRFQWVSHFDVAETDFTTGEYALNGAWVGPITVSAAGQFSPDPVSVESSIPQPNATVDVTLRLQPTSQIRGVVLLPDGIRPAGANVIVRYSSEAFVVICSDREPTTVEEFLTGDTCDSVPVGIQEETVLTDEFGRFWLPIVNAGPFRLSVEDSATGKVGHVRGSVRAGETADIQVRLLGVADLEVRVFASDTTTPIPGARVKVQQLAEPKKVVQGLADATGLITFAGGDGFSEGDVVIEATDVRNGFAGRASARITADGERVTANVYLYDMAGSVAGEVRGPDGLTLVPNAEVVVSNPGGTLAYSVTGADGRYRVDTVPLGEFAVDSFEARTGRRGSAAGRIDQDRQEVTLNIRQAGLGVVKGRLLDAATLSPLKGWTVTLSQTSPGMGGLPTLIATTAVDGSFIFPGTARGTFALRAHHANASGSASASGTIERDGEVVDIQLLATLIRPLRGAISGTVRGATGSPAANAAVELWYGGRAVPLALTADAEGRFAASDLPLGRFSVTARSQVSPEAGSAQGELAFDGDTATITVVLSGLGEIRGHVERGDGAPAAGARVQLTQIPRGACESGSCVVFADASGDFVLGSLAAGTFTLTATDPISGLSGSAGGSLRSSEIKTLRVVLAPSVTLSGRVLLPGDRAAAGAVAELVMGERQLFAEADDGGVFTFGAAPTGAYELTVRDPIGTGVATRTGVLTTNLALGDFVLDVSPPVVASVVPANDATAVPLDADIRVTFSEPIRPGTIGPESVRVAGPTGALVVTLDVTDNDTALTIHPLQPFAPETRYSIRIASLQDRVGKVMPSEYTASFTSADIQSPTIADASPAPGTGGAPIYVPVRIRFSEPINPSAFSGQAITLTGPAGAIGGRTDYLMANAIVVFTPNVPLVEDSVYTVTVAAATDLAGNAQAQPLTYQFTTTDRTAPRILSLTPAGEGRVVENGTTSVHADVGVTHDVAVVDWYINQVFAFADRAEPFDLTFQAIPDYGRPGDTVRITAIATDTSGNRGDPAEASVTVTADQPPVVTLLSPAQGAAARNGDRIAVTVRATDDLGIDRIGFRADTGRPTDALTRPVPASTDRTESFFFYVPVDAAPGSRITVSASASDTRSQVTETSVTVAVLDATRPTVTITGATSGAHVLPGQRTTVVVTAQDLGGVNAVAVTTSGILTFAETRTVEPAQNSIVTSFTLTVPVTARAGQSLTVNARAFDVAGNMADAAPIVLPVADTTAPVLRLQSETGILEAVPGRDLVVRAIADDETAVRQIDLAAEGAFAWSDGRQVSPPSGSASILFSIPVPASAVPGTEIRVTGLATDLFGNVSAPATLTFAVISPTDVTLPESIIMAAGETQEILVSLSGPAPAGLRLDFASDDENVATVTPFITFAEGETARPVTVTAIAGGVTQIRALANGVPRAAMSVSVQGGIVTGLVRDALLTPIANAQVTISSGWNTLSVFTDADGRYRATGVPGPEFSVRVLDPATRLYGHGSGSMAHPNGHATLNVILIAAVRVTGRVFGADGTPAGAGVRVDIYPAGSSVPVTTFTDDASAYEFPLVTLGDYTIDATAEDGRRGRTRAQLVETGADVTVNVTFLGYGVVSGVVRTATGATVRNAVLTFRSSTVFGSEPDIVTTAQPDGTFRFENVPVGQFTVTAVDPATGRGATANGTIASHGETIPIALEVSSYGTIQGRVLRSDNTTIVAGAKVSLCTYYCRETLSDASGQFRFEVVPLGGYSVKVFDEGTRGIAAASVSLSAHGEVQNVDLPFEPQGRLLVTVTDAGGRPVPGARVYVSVEKSYSVRDSFGQSTGADGTALLDHVLAHNYTLSVSFGSLHGLLTGVLAPGELQEVTVALEPTGSITGTIFEPDGQTPAAGAKVRVLGHEDVVTGADGVFRFDAVRMGRHDLSVYDATSRLRAQTIRDYEPDDVVLQSNGKVVSRDFTYVGLGSVSGRVINPDGSSAQNMPVLVRAHASGFQQSSGVRTDGGGHYLIANVPVGSITVSAGDATRQLYGESPGTIAQHGDVVQVDVVLTSNVIALPANLYDANFSLFDVHADGSLEQGRSTVMSGGYAVDRGGLFLDITSGGTTTRFAGGEIPTAEDGRREIAVRQENVAGLSITRKIYVPREGYFARYLEILRNPTDAPVTVDLAVVTNAAGAGMTVVRTSSGDATLDVASASAPDRWAVFGRNADLLGLGFVMQGAGAASPLSAASITPKIYYPSPYSATSYATLSHGWNQIVVPPGETVAVLHFAVQQLSHPAAIASAERLVQLPPEALAGLNAEEIAAIRNFAVPADGSSPLAPLPALTGTIVGHVFEADGSSAGPNVPIVFKSMHPLFGRTLNATTNAEGAFRFEGEIDDYPEAVPIYPFTIEARHRLSGAAALASGAFADGETLVQQDVAFGNTGIIQGRVIRSTGAVVTGGGTVYVSGGGLSLPLSVTMDADSSYRVTGLPAATYTLTAHVSHPQGTAMQVTGSATVSAGTTQDIDLIVPALGAVTGVVRTAAGAPASDVEVRISRGSEFRRATRTSTGGVFTFGDLPPGDYGLEAEESRTHMVTSGNVSVLGDATVQMTLDLIAVAPVHVQVQFAGGAAAPNVSVTLKYQGPQYEVTRSATTNVTGLAVIDAVPAVPFTATARHPLNVAVTTADSGTIAADAQPLIVSLALPAIGTVNVQVNRSNGVAAAGAAVELTVAGHDGAYNGTTDATGRVALTGVRGGAFTVKASHPGNTGLFATGTGTITGEGQVVDATLTLPAAGTVTGTVTMPNGSAAAGVQVRLRPALAGLSTVTATTDASGAYSITGVPAGSFIVSVEDLTRGVYGNATGTLANEGDTVVVNLQLQTNIVALPEDLYDGNDYRFDVQEDGSLSDGSSDAYDGGLYLRLYIDGNQSSFPSQSSALAEDAGRELAIHSPNVGGLDVTRKIFVPLEGYFARYLEIITNPGTTAVTFDAAIATDLGSDSSTYIVATSSGDRSFAPPDYWIVTDDSDGSGDPSLAHVIGGPDAARAVSAASSSGESMSYRWNGITLEPGQTIVLMHFAAQNRTRAQVRAAAERLVQLPTEALAGLSSEEIAAIANFAVPADGSSPLPELRRPALGTVTGSVLAYDGVTPVPGATVSITGQNLIFGRTVSVQSAATGIYSATSVPVETFTIVATLDIGVSTPTINGTFEPGQSTASINLTFANSGLIRGTVTRHTGALVTSGTVDMPRYTTIGSDGTYVLPVLVPATYTVRATVPHPQGSQLIGTVSATVSAGASTIANIVLPPTGEIAGIVRNGDGTPAPSISVWISGANSRSTVTASDGTYRLTDVPEGTYTVYAREPSTSTDTTGQAAVVRDVTTALDLALVSLGTVAGRITYPDGTAAASAYVRLSGSISRQTYSDAAGNYSFTGIPVGSTFTVRATPTGISSNLYREVTGVSLTSHGETVTADIVAHGVATVRVHLRNAAGAPLSGQQVSVQRASETYHASCGYTNASGYVDCVRVPEGTFSVRAYFSGPGYVYRTGAVAAADHGRTLEVTLSPPVSVSFQGTIYAADGQTPVVYARVQVFDVASNSMLVERTTYDGGTYSSGTVYIGSDGYRIRAWTPNQDASVDQTGTVTSGGQTLTVDVTLPLSVVRGTVTYSDGVRVDYPNVFVQQTTAEGVKTYYGNSYQDGTYAVLGAALGPFTVRASDDYGLSATGNGELVDVATAAVVDVTLPPAASLSGIVYAEDGSPAPNVTVMVDWGESAVMTARTGNAGVFTLPRVPLAALTIQACRSDSWRMTYCEATAARATTAGEQLSVELRLPRTGTLQVRLLEANGSALSGGSVILRSASRYLWTSELYASNGQIRIERVPEGHVEVIGFDWAYRTGIADVTLVGGRTQDVTVTLGNARRVPALLVGADGFWYDVGAAGTLESGGQGETGPNAYAGAYAIEVAHAGLAYSMFARLEEEGREVVFGPASPALQIDSGEGAAMLARPFSLTRKAYVPPGGGFIRYLDLVTNHTPIPQTILVRIGGTYAPPDADVDVVVTPAASGNLYAVMRDLRTADAAPAIAHVFAGGAAPVPIGSTSIATGHRTFTYDWQPTIQPGQTIGLLHFGIQRTATDAAGAEAQAQALATLSDPAALQGLSPAELALIVNFASVPGAQTSLTGRLSGSVFAADGQTGVTGASVYAVDVATTRQLAWTRTDADGQYVLPLLYTTTAGVRLVAASPFDNATVERIVTFTTDGESLTAIDVSVPISVIRGTVTGSDGSAVANPTVLLAATGATLTYRAETRADGGFKLLAAPPASYTLTALDPAGSRSARVTVTVAAADSVVAADVQLPATPTCTPAVPGLVGWWRAEGNGEDAIYGGAQATLSGTATYGTGRVGQGFAFPDTSGTVSIPHRPEFASPAFSLEALVQLTALDVSGNYPSGEQQLVFKRRRNASYQFEDYALVKIRRDSKNVFALRIGQPDEEYLEVFSTTPLEAGRFYHVIATFDGSVARLFVDGMLEGSVGIPAELDHGDAPMVLGRYGIYDEDAPCNCVLDELRFYDIALTAGQVQAAYAGGTVGGCTDLAIVTTVLPSCFEGQPFSATVRGLGGTAPVTFDLAAGEPPTGLTLDLNGLLAGTPSTQSLFTFDVRLSDAAGGSVTRSLSQQCGAPCLAQPAGIVAYWPADGDASDTVSYYDGYISSVSFAEGISGSAFQFTGTDYGRVSPLNADLTIQNTFTMEFWVNPAAERVSTTQSSWGTPGFSGQRYAIAPQYRGSYASAGVSVGTNGISVFERYQTYDWWYGYQSYFPSVLVHDAPISGWTHIAVVYSGRVPSLYINGQFVKQGYSSGASRTYPASTFGDTDGYGPYAGLLDEIAIYDRALTADEVAAIYQAAIRQRCPIR